MIQVALPLSITQIRMSAHLHSQALFKLTTKESVYFYANEKKKTKWRSRKREKVHSISIGEPLNLVAWLPYLFYFFACPIFFSLSFPCLGIYAFTSFFPCNSFIPVCLRVNAFAGGRALFRARYFCRRYSCMSICDAYVRARVIFFVLKKSSCVWQYLMEWG